MFRMMIVGAAAVGVTAAGARANYFTTNFTNDLTVPVYDWHLVLRAPTINEVVMTQVAGGPLNGVAWDGSIAVGGSEANLLAGANASALQPGSQLGVGITFTGTTIQGGVWDWWWTDANHAQVGPTHHYPVPAPGSITLAGAGLALMARRRRR